MANETTKSDTKSKSETTIKIENKSSKEKFQNTKETKVYVFTECFSVVIPTGKTKIRYKFSKGEIVPNDVMKLLEDKKIHFKYESK